MNRRTALIASLSIIIPASAGASAYWLFQKRDDSIATLRGHSGVVRGLCFLDETTLVSVGDSGHLQAWNSSTGSTLYEQSEAAVTLYAVAACSDSRFATVGKDGWLTIWDSGTGAKIQSAEVSQRSLECSAVHPKRNQVLTGGYDKLVHQVPLQDLKQAKHYHHHIKHVHGVAYRSDGTEFLSGSEDGQLQFWKTDSGAMVASGSIGQHHIIGISANPMTQEYYVLAGGVGLRAIDGKYHKVSDRVWANCGLARSFAVAPNGKQIVTGHENSTLKVWRTDGGEALATLVGHRGMITAVAISPDGRTIATGAVDHTVKLWNMPSY